eukprot:11983620-Alexandrium_andersonii.AAC.1
MSVLKRPACLKRPAAASEGDDETSGEEAAGLAMQLYKDGSPFEDRLAAFRKDTAGMSEAEEIAPLLNKYFSKDEQRNLYNKCRRTINGADSQVKAIWEQICNRGRNANKDYSLCLMSLRRTIQNQRVAWQFHQLELRFDA